MAQHARVARKSPYGPARRFVRVPDDAAVRRLRDDWFTRLGPVDWLAMLSPAMRGGNRVVLGYWRGKPYAMIVCPLPAGEGQANCVSAWGHDPRGAAAELAFRWYVLMAESWDRANHAPMLGQPVASRPMPGSDLPTVPEDNGPGRVDNPAAQGRR